MITIIFGKPGAGKTAYMAALATEYLNGSARCYDATTECIHAVTALKEQGFDFQQPDRAPVYTNFNISAVITLTVFIWVLPTITLK